MLRIFHNEFATFLTRRMHDGGPDAEACYRAIAHQIDNSPEETNYFMGVENPRDKKRALVSQTSLAAMIKAGIPANDRNALWTKGGHRQDIRPGRWLRAMSDIEDGYALDAFTLAIDSQFGQPDLAVEFLEGGDITIAYREASHCRCVSIGDLANSCMRYDNLRNAFNIYEKTAKLAVARCPTCQKVRGRAVAWNAGSVKYIDRRYGTGQVKQLILDTALAAGYIDVWPGEVGRSSDRRFVIPFTASVKEIKAGPYMDSFYYWCRTCNVLTNKGESCYNAAHDVTIMRGTRGTDHQGWWGRCASCGTELDHLGECPRQQTCEGCGVIWCGARNSAFGPRPSCPNNCIRCAACGSMRKQGVKDCPKGCVRCTGCGTDNQYAFLNQTHGQCRSCGMKIKDDGTEHTLRLKHDTHEGYYTARCPECNWKIVTEQTDARAGLIPCEHVHNGPYGMEGGHCRQCHAYIVMQPPPEKKEKKVDSRRISVNQYVTHRYRGEPTASVTFHMPSTQRGRD